MVFVELIIILIKIIRVLFLTTSTTTGGCLSIHRGISQILEQDFQLERR